jgi:ubiquinone/menaquinone biosynthesis C-methylase UbiE
MSRQKTTFLTSEGDAWLSRNRSALRERDWSLDPLVKKIAAICAGQARVLEIGCGDGSRLQHLSTRHGFEVYGVDPSAAAVACAIERGVDAKQATADALPFPDSSFDVVVFGFCLYLCDDEDLFQIAREADRVTRQSGWLLVLDFEAPSPVYRPYHHADGILSRKMDYASMFLWHPAYTLVSREKFDHSTGKWTDDPAEWVSVVCLRKHNRSR